MKWTAEHQQAIIEYYYCQSASTSAITRNYLFNNILYQPIKQLTEIVIRKKSNRYTVDVDLQQDMLLFIYDKVLPKLQLDKLQAAQQLIYTSLYNYYTSYVSLAVPRFNSNNCYSINNDDDSVNIIDSKSVNINEIRSEILAAIDGKIRNEKIINKRKTVYLLLLREYLINNQFDEREFKYFVMKKMNLTKEQYNHTNRSLKICGELFREKNIEYE